MSFSVGDQVTWTSQSMGVWKEKTGTVVAVVPAGFYLHCPRWSGPQQFKEDLRELGIEEPGHFNGRKIGSSNRRDHESYLVAVPTPSGRGRPRLYWPRVTDLTEEEAESEEQEPRAVQEEAL